MKRIIDLDDSPEVGSMATAGDGVKRYRVIDIDSPESIGKTSIPRRIIELADTQVDLKCSNTAVISLSQSDSEQKISKPCSSIRRGKISSFGALKTKKVRLSSPQNGYCPSSSSTAPVNETRQTLPELSEAGVKKPLTEKCAPRIAAASSENAVYSGENIEDPTRQRLDGCSEIDCYRTVRRADGKVVTEKVSLAEIERLCPVTVKVPAFQDEFAEDILKEFLQVQWRQGKRWLIDKEIVAHRLSTGFSFDRMRKQWETSGLQTICGRFEFS